MTLQASELSSFEWSEIDERWRIRAPSYICANADEYDLIISAARNLGLTYGLELELRLNVYVILVHVAENKLAQSWKDLFTQLAGPYGKTIYKMYCLRHGINEEQYHRTFAKVMQS